ncbi:hypothetical protein SR38_11045, partial [Atlantibacter hermannii]
MKKNHFSQRGAMLVALSTAPGLLAPVAYADLGNIIDQSTSANVSISGSYQTFTVTNQGMIYPPNGSAVTIGSTGQVDNFTNNGTINASWDGFGIENEGYIGTLNNTGSIRNNSGSSLTSNAIYLGATSQTDNIINSGTIGGNNHNLPGMGTVTIVNDGSVGTLTNLENGVITGSTALQNNGVIDVLNNDGTINNSNIGPIAPVSNATIINNGTINTFNNTGKLISNNYYWSSSSVAPTIRNIGTITNLNNYGTISSTQIAIDSNDAIENIHNEGTIQGDIYVGGNTPLNITGGAGVQGTLTGSMPMFGIFVSSPVIQENVGTINAGGDVNFKIGSILLNDNVITGG